jgi:hypothetical protein
MRSNRLFKINPRYPTRNPATFASHILRASALAILAPVRRETVREERPAVSLLGLPLLRCCRETGREVEEDPDVYPHVSEMREMERES